jgi:AraC-like DNA-binding protein
MQKINLNSTEVSERPVHLELVSVGPGMQAPVFVPEPSEGGLRATRIASVIAEIARGFSDQQFSTRVLASKLGLSVRYVQDLVKDSGLSITDRILELRLQKAYSLLMNDRSCMLKISDIASSCGFNEVSYFHRCFRRRFGAAPARLRARAEAAE